ncbi:MAG: hypothetical protein MET45_10090 [Nostoc sp. LLA-1]|nr:hypothetical protein [Cyanocohniella sp. LLY]
MSFIIRRRRFGHIAIASATATLLSNLTGKALAQQTRIGNIYGVKVKKNNNQSVDVENTTPGIIVTSANLISNLINLVLDIPGALVENSGKRSERKNKALSLSPRERITACTALPDGTLIISSVSSSRRGDVTRFMFVDSKSNAKSKLKKALKITNFKKNNDVLESVVATKDGTLIGAISSAGVPPFELGTIDYQKGEVISDINPFQSINNSPLPEIPPDQRIANLTASSDGTIYATRIGAESSVKLAKIDLFNKSRITGKGRIINLVELSFNDKPLGNDVLDLAFSAADQLYALANIDYQETNSLYTVDMKTGKMKFVKRFDADKFVFIP